MHAREPHALARRRVVARGEQKGQHGQLQLGVVRVVRSLRAEHGFLQSSAGRVEQNTSELQRTLTDVRAEPAPASSRSRCIYVMPDADNDSCPQADECYIVPQLPGMSIQVHASICSPAANPGGSAQ